MNQMPTDSPDPVSGTREAEADFLGFVSSGETGLFRRNVSTPEELALERKPMLLSRTACHQAAERSRKQVG